MTRKDAVKHLENMKWLLGVNNTTVDDIPLAKVIDDIAALVKAQEPRLLTCADFEANPMLDDDGRLPCWREDLIYDSGWTAVSVESVFPDHIKANWCRYWTSRPTDEQREAVKWDDA